MLLFHKIVFRELLITFTISLIFLNFTLMMEKLLRLSRLLAGVGASAADVGGIILNLQPQILILTIPMSLLLSVLLTYGRMNSDNEITIARASGMSFRLLSLPVMVLGFLCFGAGLAMSLHLSPKSSVQIREKVTEILTRRAALTIEEGIFNTAFRDIVVLVREKPTPYRLRGIVVIDERNKDEQRVITAEEGAITQEKDSLGFLLLRGRAYITKSNRLTEISFGSYHITLTPSFGSGQRSLSELTPKELLKSRGTDRDEDMHIYVEFHRRFSLPAVCIIVAFLGPALSLMAGRTGRLGGLTIGLLVFVAYYGILVYGEHLSRSGHLPHYIGSWLSFALLCACAAFVFERVNRK